MMICIMYGARNIKPEVLGPARMPRRYVMDSQFKRVSPLKTWLVSRRCPTHFGLKKNQPMVKARTVKVTITRYTWYGLNRQSMLHFSIFSFRRNFSWNGFARHNIINSLENTRPAKPGITAFALQEKVKCILFATLTSFKTIPLHIVLPLEGRRSGITSCSAFWSCSSSPASQRVVGWGGDDRIGYTVGGVGGLPCNFSYSAYATTPITINAIFSQANRLPETKDCTWSATVFHAKPTMER